MVSIALIASYSFFSTIPLRNFRRSDEAVFPSDETRSPAVINVRRKRNPICFKKNCGNLRRPFRDQLDCGLIILHQRLPIKNDPLSEILFRSNDELRCFLIAYPGKLGEVVVMIRDMKKKGLGRMQLGVN
jgi:hypothetical protein